MIIRAVLVIILAILHRFGKALRDTVAHHFGNSVFHKVKSHAFYVWLRSDWQDKPKHIFVPLWDAWHFGDFLTIVCPLLFAALGFMWGYSWGEMVEYMFWMFLVLNLLYKKLFITKNPRIIIPPEKKN